ncbi:MAG: SRPBCC family protein [Ferrovibrio sp.]|uniref:SRPBCC family protein n=1 Tax=Ferrovibrio sp. TaxID=1917215 RepID=UPI002610337B|nr:SRPBCC family protein [Ferrovibrio sp.]MCW0234443.1 SRPBCC family protein [Ferrovibrio sp.]
MKAMLLLCALGGLMACNARAEVSEAASDHFLIGFSARVEAPPAKVYVALGEVARWWSAEHTWSGTAANLSLKAEAGGCFCERWAAGSAEHGRVVMALKNELLRLDAALGPLQERAVNGVLSFSLQPMDDGATRLDVDYRVNASSGSGLEQIAPAVDNVLAMQIDRLLRYIDTGSADETPAAEAAEAAEPPSRRAARAELIEEWSRQAAAARAAKGNEKPRSGKPAVPPKP